MVLRGGNARSVVYTTGLKIRIEQTAGTRHVKSIPSLTTHQLKENMTFHR